MELAKRGGGRWLAAAGLAAVVAGAAAPASAHGRVIIGGVVGYPAYPYAYPYAPPYVVYPYPAGVYWDPAPPPGFVPGHWEVDYDRKGRRVRVWVPGHLR